MKKKILIIGGAVLGVLLVGFILIGIFAPPAPKTAAQPAATQAAKPVVTHSAKPVVKVTAKPAVTPTAVHVGSVTNPDGSITTTNADGSTTTTAPTIKSTPVTPTQVAPTQVSYMVPAQGQPHLGGPLSAFYSAFAGANDVGPDLDGVTHDYSFYDPRVSGPNGPIAYISVAALGNTVVDILLAPLPKSWDASKVLTYTQEFLPPDALQDSTATRYNGATIQYTSHIAGPFSMMLAYGVPESSLDTPSFQ